MIHAVYQPDIDQSRSVFEDNDLLSLCALYASGRNESFAIVDGADVLNCPFVIDSEGVVSTGSPSLLPMPRLNAPGNVRAQRVMMAEFISLATRQSQRVELRICPTLPSESLDLRPFLENGFEVKVDFTSVVDLAHSEEALNRSMRKSYPGAVKRVAREFDIEHMTGADALGSSVLDQWLELYARVSNRTDHHYRREIDDLTKRLFQKELFHLFYTQAKGTLISGAVVACNRVHGYYWQAATQPDFKGTAPFAHALLWRALCELKARSVSFFETGQVFVDPSNAKAAAIAFFKLGVGGRVCPWLTLSWGQR